MNSASSALSNSSVIASLAFLGYSIRVFDIVAKNASGLARSAAEVKPAHAGAQYISLANTVGCSSEDVTRRCRWDAMIAHIYNMIGDVAQWSGRRSLAGGLSLIPDL